MWRRDGSLGGLWDLTTGTLLRAYQSLTSATHHLRLLSDDRRFVTAQGDGSVLLELAMSAALRDAELAQEESAAR